MARSTARACSISSRTSPRRSPAAGFPQRSAGLRQARDAASPSTSPATRVIRVRRAARRAWPGKLAAAEAEPGTRRAELEKIAEVCRHVPAHAPARFPRGPAVLLVLPPGGHHGTERLGFLQPRPSGPAPAAVLRAGTGRRLADAASSARELLECFLHQVQQPSRAAQGGGHRRRKRHLHRLRQHQHRRPAAATGPTAPTKFPTSCWTSWTGCTCCSRAPTSSFRAKARTPSSSTPCASSARAMASPPFSTPTPWCRSNCARARRLEDARAGGCSGCVEVGAFGKEAYILTGYFNMLKCWNWRCTTAWTRAPAGNSGRAPATPDSFRRSRICLPRTASSSSISWKSNSAATSSSSGCTPRSCPRRS